MRVLFIFPQAGSPYSRQEILERTQKGELPDTLLMGANRLSNYNIEVDYLLASEYTVTGHPPYFHLWQQFDALRLQDRYDLIVCKDLMTGYFLGLFRKAGMLHVPLVLLDLVLSEDTPFQRLLSKALDGFDRVVCATPSMEKYANDQLDVTQERLTMLPWAIDTEFWNPENVSLRTDDQLLISCGSNHRDFETLVRGIQPTDYEMEIITQGEVPNEPFVTQSTYTPVELRERYARAKAVILPLYDVPSASGITVALEAMAMGTPLIITRSRGIDPFLEDGQNAIVIPPGSPQAIQTSLERIRDPNLSEKLRNCGRNYVESVHSIGKFTEDMVDLFDNLPYSSKQW